MRAIVKPTPAVGFDYRTDVADPALDAHQVRIEVAAASICGTDRELVNYTATAKAFGLNLPLVLGHEFAGTVVETGPAVTALRVDDRVALESHIACGHCYHCRVGQGHNCLNMQLLGLHVDGGFAERAVVVEQACYKLPDEVPLEVGALFESAGVAMHALLRSGHTLAGESMLVAGGGPIGLVLVQLGQALGARQVVVVEPNPFRCVMAEALGAPSIPATMSTGGVRGRQPIAAGSTSASTAPVRPARSTWCWRPCVARPPRCAWVSPTRRSRSTSPGTRSSMDSRSKAASGDRYGPPGIVSARWSRQSASTSAALLSHRLALVDFGEALALLQGDAGKVLLIPGLTETERMPPKGDATP